MRITRITTIVVCSSLLAFVPVFAGVVGGEVDAVWWAHDFEAESASASGSADAGAPGLRAALWVKERYGVQASQFSSEIDDVATEGADYTSVDFMWRALAPSQNNYLAVGLGWQQMDLPVIGMDGNTSGARLSLQGRIGFIDKVFGYGQGSYSPTLEDARATDPAFGEFTDMSGYEYELGVGWNALPYMTVKAGFRGSQLDFTQAGLAGLQGGGSTASTPMPPTTGGSPGGLGFPNPESISSPAALGSGGSLDGNTSTVGYFVGLGIRF